MIDLSSPAKTPQMPACPPLLLTTSYHIHQLLATECDTAQRVASYSGEANQSQPVHDFDVTIVTLLRLCYWSCFQLSRIPYWSEQSWNTQVAHFRPILSFSILNNMTSFFWHHGLHKRHQKTTKHPCFAPERYPVRPPFLQCSWKCSVSDNTLKYALFCVFFVTLITFVLFWVVCLVSYQPVKDFRQKVFH